MALYGYNRTTAAVARNGVTFPASTAAGVDGPRIELTYSWQLLSRGAWGQLAADQTADTLRFEWSSPFAEFPTGALIPSIHEVQRSKRFGARGASTVNFALNGADSATQDGITYVAGENILLPVQTAGAENGIYRVGAVAAGLITQIARAPEMNVSAEVSPGTEIFVSEGTTNEDTIFYVSNAAAITLGTTALTFARQKIEGSSVSLQVRNASGGDFAANSLVYVNGFHVASGQYTVGLTDADLADVGGPLGNARTGMFILRAILANGTNGTAFKTARVTGLNTAGSAVGRAVFLDTAVAGGWALADPAGATANSWVIGRVEVVDAAVGVINFDLNNASIQRLGRLAIQDGAINAAKTDLTDNYAWTGAHSFGALADFQHAYRIEEVAVAFAASPYAVLAGDSHLAVDTSGGAVVINLQTAAAAGLGRRITIKHTAGTAAVSVVPNLAETIDGANATLIVKRGGSVTLSSDAAAGWTIVAEHKPGTVVTNGDAALDLGVAGLNIEVVTGAPGGGGNAYTLPLATGALSRHRAILVKNLVGSAGAITVTRSGADLIDGAITSVLAAEQSALYIDAVAAVWVIA